MKHRRVYVALVVLLLAGIGCNLPSEVEATLTETEANTPSQTISVEPVDTPQKSSTETPKAEVLETLTPSTEAIQPFLPVGFITASEDGDIAIFYDLSGNLLGSIEIPGFGATREQFHIAGSFGGDPNDVPVVYLKYENMENIK